MRLTHRAGHHGIIFLGGALASAALLAGCASSPESAGNGDSDDSGSVALTVFAAASLSPVFDEITDAFTRHHPIITFAPSTFDGSSTLLTQITEGAPADVFASADTRTMTMASEKGALNPTGLPSEEPVIFATNTLTIVVPPTNPAKVSSVQDLARTDVRTVLCAPQVPCGAASRALLSAQRVTVAPIGEELSVTAVLKKVAIGEADAGLVYVTDARAAGDTVRSVTTAGAEDVVSEYPASVVAGSTHPEEAASFVRFLGSEEVQEILTRHGFGSPHLPVTASPDSSAPAGAE